MSAPQRSGLIHLADARTALPPPGAGHSARIFRGGTLDVWLAGRPAVSPTQLGSHEQDEVYIVLRGRGVLFHDGKRDAFEAGDLMFVAAGIEHRFEDFSDDLEVWVVFYDTRPESG
jgi:mannose-6-phosphate isomerase-like protein (cupin superfamily)